MRKSEGREKRTSQAMSDSTEKLLSIRIHRQGFQDRKVGKKTYKSFSSMLAHNNRTEEMDDDYLLNPEYQHQNICEYKYESEAELQPLLARMNSDYKDYHKRKIPSNTLPLIDGLITFSQSMRQDVEIYGIDKMSNAVKEFLDLEFGGGEIIGFIYHADETTPHWGFSALNYNFDTHKTYSKTMEKAIGESEFRQNDLQDRLAEFLKLKIPNFEYKRGKINSIKKYHSDRAKQQEHIKQQSSQIQEQEELIKSQESKIQEQDELIEKLSARTQNIITSIVKDLTELGRKSDGDSFLKKVRRYAGSDNKHRMDNLINKYQNALTKIKSKSTPHQNELK